MSDVPQDPSWWLASDGRWYPPQQPAPREPRTINFGIVLAVLAVMVLAGIGVSVAVARSHREATMTRREFDRIAVGMTLDEVESVVGGPGTSKTYPDGSVVVSWANDHETCHLFDAATVEFRLGRVAAKYAGTGVC